MDFSDESPQTPQRSVMQGALQLYAQILRKPRRNFIIMTAAFLLGNLILPGQFHGSENYLAMFFVGALATQLGLIATSCSMSERTSYDSWIVGILLVLFVWSSYVAGLRMHNEIPLEASLFLLGLALAAFAIGQITLRQISLRAHWIIRHRSATGITVQSSQPISIKFLMLSTAAVAITIFLLKLTLPFEKSQGWPPKLNMFVTGSVLVLGFSLAIHVSAVFITLSKRFRWVALVWLIIALLVLPLVYAWLLELLTREQIYRELTWTYSYFLGHASFTLVSLLIVRWIGYRIRGKATSVQEKEPHVQ